MISCQNGIGKKRDVETQKKTIPSTEYQKTEKSIPKFNRAKPAKKPLEKEIKKKKIKAIDTLKPVVARP